MTETQIPASERHRPTRRGLLKALAGLVLAGTALAGYGFAVEPLLRLAVTRYRFNPPGWPADLRLKIAVLADIHAIEPWMPASRVAGIAERTNSLGADMVLLLGDFVSTMRVSTGPVAAADWAAALAGLRAPLGVHAILGNHDWWSDAGAQRRRQGPTEAANALEAAGIPVYENDAVRLTKDGRGFWLAGLGDQLAFDNGVVNGHRVFSGVDDLDATLAQVTDDAPVLLMAHEPDIFPTVPDRVALTLCGHTHGGQVRLFGYSPVVPSSYGNRFAYGHIVETGRHLLVSGGLGSSIVPLRFGVPPEIVLIELGGGDG
ncbi:Ser/Thr protein phosphatase family protein [hydrothermal vent metagenome]|uniref:Ser/Thr protein phosphatase family protein n=1 Tax=hydrothermal vent metagenome TaxID=652676 RepID=A0A3B0TYG7_9ZZZZ